MELAIIFSTSLITALSGAMMPGPLLTVTISNAAEKGRMPAIMLITGHAVLELILTVGFFFGLYAVLRDHTVIRIISILGGTFLAWMGYRMVSDSYKGRVSLDFSSKGDLLCLGPVFQGIATSISNPYWTIWWVTIGSNFMLSSLKYGLAGVSSFYLGHIVGDYLWYIAIAHIVIAGKRFVTDNVFRGVLFACGLFLVILAAAFILGLSVF